MSQVKKCTLALFLWITLHNAGFDLTAPAYHSGNLFHVQLFDLFLFTAYIAEKSPSQISPVLKSHPFRRQTVLPEENAMCEGSYKQDEADGKHLPCFYTAPDLLRSYLQHCCPPEKEVL